MAFPIKSSKGDLTNIAYAAALSLPKRAKAVLAKCCGGGLSVFQGGDSFRSKGIEMFIDVSAYRSGRPAVLQVVDYSGPEALKKCLRAFRLAGAAYQALKGYQIVG